MNRRRLESVAVVALLVLVVGLSAATLGTTTTQGTAGTGGGSTSGTGPGGGSAQTSAPTPVSEVSFPWIRILSALFVLVLVVGAVRYPLDTVLEVGRSLVMAVVVVAGLWLLFVLTGVGGFPTDPPQDDSEGLGLGPPDAAPGGTEGTVTSTSPELLGLLVAGLVGLALVAVVVRDLASADGESTTTDGDEETLAAIGRSAGRAADRLADADADLDNEVYRAWREMTDHLEVDNPGTRTPGEFRATALSAGMARGDVETLTDLFEVVRYGGATPTAEREETAVASLRRIEERYAGEGET
jgi:hypothetical protein